MEKQCVISTKVQTTQKYIFQSHGITVLPTLDLYNVQAGFSYFGLYVIQLEHILLTCVYKKDRRGGPHEENNTLNFLNTPLRITFLKSFHVSSFFMIHCTCSVCLACSSCSVYAHL
jgi:hypothetical protein